MGVGIVNNAGVNYTLYYNVLNYFKTILNNHPSVAAVTWGDISMIDTKEFQFYPFANVLITDTSFGTSITEFTVQITVADKIKNKNNESTDRTNYQNIPFYGTDDVVDIHSNTLAILNDITAYTQRGVVGFEVNDDILCTPFMEQYNNGLAGWVATFKLTTHNDKNRCLFFLINPSGSGYVIQDCITGTKYNAVLQQTGSVGQIFSAPYVAPNAQSITTSYGVNCYTIIDTISGDTDDFNLVNLQILQVPTASFENCPECLAWISPQVWSTSVNSWNLAPDKPYRTWAKA